VTNACFFGNFVQLCDGIKMSSGFEADVATISNIKAVPTILEVICATTGMGFAAVARVTPDRWIACGVRDGIAFGLQPGGELKVETTICHEIRQNREARRCAGAMWRCPLTEEIGHNPPSPTQPEEIGQ
jgi:hypothetical protein